MVVQDAKTKSTAKGLTIGTGGPTIKDAIDNSLKALAKKVRKNYARIQ